MKYIVKFIKVIDTPKEGDFIVEKFTNKVGVLGKYGADTGASEMYNLDGSFYDTIDMFSKVIPSYKRANLIQELIL